MKKWIAVVLAGTLLLLSACGAPAGSEDIEIDLEALAGHLLESGVFEETLYKADDGIAEILYGIDGASAALVYIGSGAVADELALFEFADEAEAQSAISAAEARIASQKDSFATYIPEEVPKLDNAVVETHGRYLIVCVSGQDNASEIISDYLEQGE